jgi:hypothetical protein
MMVCSNVKSGRLFAGNERLRTAAMLPFLAFGLSLDSARAQFADEEIFATPSSNIEWYIHPVRWP